MSSTHIGEHKESGVGPGDTLEHASHRDIIHLALSPPRLDENISSKLRDTAFLSLYPDTGGKVEDIRWNRGPRQPHVDAMSKSCRG